MRPVALAVLCWVAALVLVGCNSDPSGVGKTVPVHGKVTVDGKPLTTGTVAFQPDKRKGNLIPHVPGAEIDAEGNYKLITATKPGAPLGWYKVVVVSTEPPNPQDPFASRKSHIDMKYGTAEKTVLEIEVVEQPEPGAYDLSLKSPGR
ncbi:hypothetical protein AYO40_05445 [Planctomycetaceae bacterium SCGC AG-212-D15]|nr:hypothetical protein AYO40_05445 [Planctomycetaceae bacterium SCGC AG-212-D15]